MSEFRNPLRLYGSKISYYTGKMEGYLRYKGIAYEFVAATPRQMRKMRERTGASQMPAIELPDGRFMTDTTPMIDWFESEYPSPPVIPEDPKQRFFSKLLEDYAEEWLWRPAMHYRWSYASDRAHLSRKIVDELMGDIPLPGILKRALIRFRQHTFYVKHDGVSSETWDHVESIYLKTLAQLETIFLKRPFLLGGSPSLADFGFFASMFRHFAQDPTASELMRIRAPAVFEWQARLWNAGTSEQIDSWLEGIPNDWSPILIEIAKAYLPFLNANAEAWAAGRNKLETTIQGVSYQRIPVSQYRVWCLEQLRSHFLELRDNDSREAQNLLEATGCWQPLFELDLVESGYDPEGIVPFQGRKVHYDNAQ